MPEESQVDNSAGAASQSGAVAHEPWGAGLNEDTVLSRLADHDLASEIIEQISKDAGLIQSRKVRLVMASHPRTPRRIALRLIRELYTFDLMQFAIRPTAPADLRHVADELLISRLASITLGERIALARRCSEKVAGALLLDKETRVWQTALESPRLTEAGVVRALQKAVTGAFVESVSHHAKWSARPEIRMALLRNAHTPLARALEFACRLAPAQLRDVLHASRLPERIKVYLRKELESRR
ncbi:MAG TPA: hypothetical protein VKQ11_17810 [Candidatus Sulfotelmatobacter sp.]|nr:hypothetical protein [Candidatus Sulfotelmatobacter sp.]